MRRLDMLVPRDPLEQLLRASGVDYDVLVGPHGKARDDEARFASRVLFELSESVHPGPMKEFMAGVVGVA